MDDNGYFPALRDAIKNVDAAASYIQKTIGLDRDGAQKFALMLAANDLKHPGATPAMRAASLELARRAAIVIGTKK